MNLNRPLSTLGRRSLLLMGAAALGTPMPAQAFPAREITWDDLIPLGVPYAEIIGPGFMDEAQDVWQPVYDDNATKFNESLSGQLVKLPGFIIPLEIGAEGVTSFVLVPYVGACIHVPPPPPNQLVFVTTETPWPGDQLWDAVWVIGTIRTNLQATEIAQTGYEITAVEMEVYEW